MTCIAAGEAASGQYGNIGTVTATTPDGSVVTDSDPSHYYGAPFAIDWANLQWPPSVEYSLSAGTPTAPINGQVFIDGMTAVPGATHGLSVQVGFGPDGSMPENNPDWTWVDAVFYIDFGNNDEYVGQLMPEAPGTYDYAFRYSATEGNTWLYADFDGTGNGYDPSQAGDLVVTP
jgi:hypothetical protein